MSVEVMLNAMYVCAEILPCKLLTCGKHSCLKSVLYCYSWHKDWQQA